MFILRARTQTSRYFRSSRPFAPIPVWKLFLLGVDLLLNLRFNTSIAAQTTERRCFNNKGTQAARRTAGRPSRTGREIDAARTKIRASVEVLVSAPSESSGAQKGRSQIGRSSKSLRNSRQARPGAARHRWPRQGRQGRQGVARQGPAWQGKAGMAGHGMARRGRAWQARQSQPTTQIRSIT